MSHSERPGLLLVTSASRNCSDGSCQIPKRAYILHQQLTFLNTLSQLFEAGSGETPADGLLGGLPAGNQTDQSILAPEPDMHAWL